MAVALSVYDGAIVRFDFTFTDLLTKLPADPADVAFVYDTDQTDFAEVTWIYGTNLQLVRDEEGDYHADVDTTGMAPEGGKAYLTGEPFGSAEGEGTVQANEPATVLVLANPVTNPFPSE